MYTLSKKTHRLVKATPDSKEIFDIPKIAKVWKNVAPMTRLARRELHEKCKSTGHIEACFLDVRKSKTGKLIYKYPICDSAQDCKIQCQGLKSAINATFRVENKFKNVSSSDPIAFAHAQKEIKHARKIRNKALKILKVECGEKR